MSFTQNDSWVDILTCLCYKSPIITDKKINLRILGDKMMQRVIVNYRVMLEM